MQVLLQLLLSSKASSCFRTATGFWQWSQPLVQAGGTSPKYLAMAAWRHLEQAAGQRQGVGDSGKPAFIHLVPELRLSITVSGTVLGITYSSSHRHLTGILVAI